MTVLNTIGSYPFEMTYRLSEAKVHELVKTVVVFADGSYDNGVLYSDGAWQEVNVPAGGKLEFAETLEINKNGTSAEQDKQKLHVTMHRADDSKDSITLTDVKVEITSSNVTIQKAAE